MQETGVRSLDWEDLLKKGKATHSSILDWRIPWTEEPGTWGCRELNMTECLTPKRNDMKHLKALTVFWEDLFYIS